MSEDAKHKIKLSELEMKLILESVNSTGYAGIHSDLVSRIRRKMTIKRSDNGEPQLQPVADLVRRLPHRSGSSTEGG